jgi:hypothetical protein
MSTALREALHDRVYIPRMLSASFHITPQHFYQRYIEVLYMTPRLSLLRCMTVAGEELESANPLKGVGRFKKPRRVHAMAGGGRACVFKH